MKNKILNFALLGSAALITPSLIDNVNFLIQDVKADVNFVWNEETSTTNFGFLTSARPKFYTDSQGRIWVTTRNTNNNTYPTYMSSDAGKTFKEMTIYGIANNHPIVDILEGVNGSTWVIQSTTTTTQNPGFAIYWAANGVNFGLNNLIPGNNPGGSSLSSCSIYYDRAANVTWICTNLGLFYTYDGTNIIKCSAGLPNNFSPIGVFTTNTGITFAYDNKNIYETSDKTNFNLNVITGLPSENINPQMYQDKDGNLYFVSNGHAYKSTNGLNPTRLTNFIDITANVPDYGTLQYFFIDFSQTIWISVINNTTGTGASTYYSKDFGANWAKSTLSAISNQNSNFFQDANKNLWVGTANGLRVCLQGTADFLSTVYLPGATMTNSNCIIQAKDNTLLAVSSNASSSGSCRLFECSNEVFTDTGYTTDGSIYNQTFEGRPYIFASDTVWFHANDKTVTTVNINGQITNVNGQGFLQPLYAGVNGGIFSISVNYSNGSNYYYYFYVIPKNNTNLAQFITSTSNTLEQYKGYIGMDQVNSIFIGPNTVPSVPNLQILFEGQGYNPVPNFNNCYYEQVDPSTLNVIPNTKVNISGNINITGPGFYLVTLSDQFGQTNKYYVQLSNDLHGKRYIPNTPAKGWVPLSPSQPVSRQMPIGPSHHSAPWNMLLPSEPLFSSQNNKNPITNPKLFSNPTLTSNPYNPDKKIK